jgi:hypothetical protein
MMVCGAAGAQAASMATNTRKESVVKICFFTGDPP